MTMYFRAFRSLAWVNGIHRSEVMPGAPGTRGAGRHRWRIVTWIERIVCLLTRVSQTQTQTQTQGLGGYEGKEI